MNLSFKTIRENTKCRNLGGNCPMVDDTKSSSLLL